MNALRPLALRLPRPLALRHSSALAAAATRLPGVAASVAVMQAGFYAAEKLSPLLLSSATSGLATGPSVLSGIPVAIVLGMALGNGPLALPKALEPGLKFAQTNLLRAGTIAGQILQINWHQTPPPFSKALCVLGPS